MVALVLLSFALGVEANSVDPIKQTKPAARAPQLTRANPKASIAVGADGSLAPSAAGQLAQVRSLPDPFCANGVLARGGNACCPAACGSCGGPDCEQRPGGDRTAAHSKSRLPTCHAMMVLRRASSIRRRSTIRWSALLEELALPLLTIKTTQPSPLARKHAKGWLNARGLWPGARASRHG